MPKKRYLNINVLDAAKERISWAFDTFPKICVSFSGGKDSTVMLHLVAEEAKKRNRKFGLFFVDWEAQFSLTISHVQKMFEVYQDIIEPYWIAVPLTTVNAVSQFEPEWTCWEPGKEKVWVREKPKIAFKGDLPFHYPKIKFEEFVPAFMEWYGGGEKTACFVGIRSGESLNRWRTIASEKKGMYENKNFTTKSGEGVYNIYPIYDWRTEDIWTYHGKNPEKQYNLLYDRMYQAGVPLHNMRICEPYGSEQRQGLWLFHIIEPETWNKVVSRVQGVNMGAIYGKEKGNILGLDKVTLPNGQTWKSFAMLLLETMPITTSEHYKNKIAIYLHWYQSRGYPEGIPDFLEGDMGSKDDKPSWRRICKILLRNDYWCRGLSFSYTKSSAYSKYSALMKRRREKWNLI